MATNITYNDKAIATLRGLGSAIIACGGTKMQFDIVVSTMDKVNVSYGGSIIATLEQGQTATLRCAGWFMNHHINVICVAVTPSPTAILGQALLGYAVLGGGLEKLASPRIRLESYSDIGKLDTPVIYIEDVTDALTRLTKPKIWLEDSDNLSQLATPIIRIETTGSSDDDGEGSGSTKLTKPMIWIEDTTELYLDPPDIYLYIEPLETPNIYLYTE